MSNSLNILLQQVSQCRLCETNLPLGPRPVVRASDSARLLIIGQAPGTKVHASGIPWDDASGKRLREWLGLSPEQFYDEKQIAIMPMGFCYPGKGKQGDLPPRPECAPHWHQRLLSHMTNIELTLLIGQYAQRYYLKSPFKTLTDNVRHWQQFTDDGQLPLPHPSPRNQLWLKKNPWFEQTLLPPLKSRIQAIIKK
ncbi:uracil-DNA glycosylase family protein [Corallincola platygyrae]|uniref:Uracil-DNA glycosylase family protein n=1 Tax=Corallincola platygyrae TaxID=1193278 RepID=A0ABW4XP48_9GAMM